jgi:hypothetical protein
MMRLALSASLRGRSRIKVMNLYTELKTMVLVTAISDNFGLEFNLKSISYQFILALGEECLLSTESQY